MADVFMPQNDKQARGMLVNLFIRNHPEPAVREVFSQIGQNIRDDPKAAPFAEQLDNDEQEYLSALNAYNQQHQQRTQAQSNANSGGLLSLGLSFGPGGDSGGTAAAQKESVLENVAAKNTGTNIGSTSATVNKYNRTAWEKALNNANDWRR